MNPTEKLAYDWLISKGADPKAIIFSSKKSPDFVTNIGQYEVKKAQRKNIIFTTNQVNLLESSEITFLVYSNQSQIPLVLKAQELKEQFKIFIQDSYNPTATGIRVSNDLVEKVKKKLNCSSDTPTVYVVDQALRVFLEKKA